MLGAIVSFSTMAVAGRAFRALQLYRAVLKDFDGLHDYPHGFRF